MKTKFIVLLSIVSVLIGCNKDKSEPAQPEAPKEEMGFKFSVNVVAKKDDTFSLFYTEDGTTNFTEPIWLAVKGSDSAQDVVFTLPEDAVPTQFRLDMGMSKDQEPMIINGFKMSYRGKTFEVPGSDFYIYFDADKSKTIYDREKQTVTAVVKDGQRQYPSFYPNTAPLGEAIKKVMQ